MPRMARILPEVGTFHILARGNNRQEIFHQKEDFYFYKKLLKKYKSLHHPKLYHYTLMPNHIHLVLETVPKTSLSKMMQGINLSYYHYYRKKYNYWGHFWQDRFKSLLIEKEKYLLACGLYVERNALSANIVSDLKKYPWTSYRVYAFGEYDSLIDINPLYLGLGKTSEERQRIYREIAERTISKEEDEQIFKRHFYGSQSFIQQMERKFGVTDIIKKRGRPRKQNGK